MNDEIYVILLEDGSVAIDYPPHLTALDVVERLNQAVRIAYQAAIKEEAERLSQQPKEIERMINIVRNQKDPKQN